MTEKDELKYEVSESDLTRFMGTENPYGIISVESGKRRIRDFLKDKKPIQYLSEEEVRKAIDSIDPRESYKRYYKLMVKALSKIAIPSEPLQEKAESNEVVEIIKNNLYKFFKEQEQYFDFNVSIERLLDEFFENV